MGWVCAPNFRKVIAFAPLEQLQTRNPQVRGKRPNAIPLQISLFAGQIIRGRLK
jgi:hypothetical protein